MRVQFCDPMKDTKTPNPKHQKQMKTNSLPILPTAALTAAAVALGAAFLLASPSAAEDKKATFNSDENFIKDEAASGAAMVKIATLAKEKAGREDVKAFAGTLVTDHTKANAELAKFAAAKGVELSTEVSPKHADTIESLEGLSGAEFDKKFLSTVLGGHEKCVRKFEEASTDAKDDDLKAWAAGMLPTLRSHLAKAKELGAESTTDDTSDADNTERNTRDRDGGTLTPLDQGDSKADTETTAQIRKAILDVEGLSLNAKNVKVITKDGLVTLRGPVKSAEEKRQIGEIATRIAGDDKTDNQLEVKETGDSE